MGAGIAIVAARAGFTVRVFDVSSEAIDRARGQTADFLEKSVARGKLSPSDRDTTLARLTGSTRIADLADCEFVIEAIYENLAAKHELLGQLDQVCPPETIFASNTSTISITSCAIA